MELFFEAYQRSKSTTSKKVLTLKFNSLSNPYDTKFKNNLIQIKILTPIPMVHIFYRVGHVPFDDM